MSKIILEEKHATLTTDTLTIKGEFHKLSEIEKAWVNKAFFNTSLKIRLNSGEERTFKRFVHVPASLVIGSGSSSMAFIYSRLDLWASNINTQIEMLKQGAVALVSLKCTRCGANLDASLKCSHCGLQHRTN